MFTSAKLALTAVLSLAFSPLVAQDRATGGGEVVVMELVATERMSLGRLDSCELTYLLAYEDYIYRNGAITFLRGSMNFAGFINDLDKNPTYLFKVTAFDFDGQSYDLSPLKYAYLSTQDISYAGKEFVIGAAEDGGLVVGYDAFSNIAMSFTDPISLNITREEGSSDVMVPVYFMMHDPNVSLQYTECMLHLLSALGDQFD